MITRQLVSHSFKTEKTQPTEGAQLKAAGYQSPKAVTVGRSQELLQGSWGSGYVDSWGSNYWRTYPG